MCALWQHLLFYVIQRIGIGRSLASPLGDSSMFSPLLSQARSRGAWRISQGKIQNVPHVNAGFIKHTHSADGGLRRHVPARPGCTTPRIRFLFVAPCFRIGLPPDPASRRRPCPSPSLRLRFYLARGLSPRSLCTMPGTHGMINGRRRRSAVLGWIYIKNDAPIAIQSPANPSRNILRPHSMLLVSSSIIGRVIIQGIRKGSENMDTSPPDVSGSRSVRLHSRPDRPRSRGCRFPTACASRQHNSREC